MDCENLEWYLISWGKTLTTSIQHRGLLFEKFAQHNSTQLIEMKLDQSRFALTKILNRLIVTFYTFLILKIFNF